VLRVLAVVVGLYQMVTGVYGLAMVLWYMPGWMRRLTRVGFVAMFLRALLGKSFQFVAGLWLLGEGQLWLWAALSLSAFLLAVWDARSAETMLLKAEP